MDVTLILVTLLSLALAAVMTVVSWRLAREERRRSEARVAALATEIQPTGDLPLQQRTPVATANDMFASTTEGPRSSSPSRSSAASSPQSSAAANRGAVAAPANRNEPNAVSVPLELTALTHERDANRLTVRGLVRNPASGGAVRGITAVVFLFDRSGDFVTSGRAPIDALPPGAESSFAVTIPDVKDVGRYRVSFRTDDRILPHVDRRERPLAEAR